MVDKAKNWWTAGAYLGKLELWRVSTLATTISAIINNSKCAGDEDE